MIAILFSLCIILPQARPGAVHQLFENSPSTAAAYRILGKPEDPESGITPLGPEMCFYDEYCGMRVEDLEHRYGPPTRKTIAQINAIANTFVGSFLRGRTRVPNEKGGKILCLIWVKGEWELDAYFYPTTKRCLGSVRWNTVVVEF